MYMLHIFFIYFDNSSYFYQHSVFRLIDIMLAKILWLKKERNGTDASFPGL